MPKPEQMLTSVPGLPKGRGCGSDQLSASVLASKRNRSKHGTSPGCSFTVSTSLLSCLPQTYATSLLQLQATHLLRKELIPSLQGEFAAHPLLESFHFGPARGGMREVAGKSKFFLFGDVLNV